MKEIWRPVEGLGNIILVSNLGNAWSVKRKRLLTKKRIKNTYFYVSFVDNNKKYRCVCLHRLVAKAFIPNPLNKEQVNHLNADKLDNRVENLEWCTRLENMRHAKNLGLLASQKGELNARVKLKEQDVLELRRLDAGGGYKRTELSEKFGICLSQVYRIANRKMWPHI